MLHLQAYLKEAAKLNDDEVKVLISEIDKAKKDFKVPGYFLDEITKNKLAIKTFENFSYSHKKEYVEWITEAKTDETRNRRIESAIEMMTEGKPRNWKYMKK